FLMPVTKLSVFGFQISMKSLKGPVSEMTGRSSFTACFSALGAFVALTFFVVFTAFVAFAVFWVFEGLEDLSLDAAFLVRVVNFFFEVFFFFELSFFLLGFFFGIPYP